ncbi:MAG: hypothetical protein AAF517_28350, partial [Planctomycetota bacterium]
MNRPARDIYVWWRLAEFPDGDELVELLEEACRVPATHRLSLYGFAVHWARHERAVVRELCARLLEEATGFHGFQVLCELLDDADAKVRESAVRSLETIAHAEPTRLAFALFHPREDVRRFAADAAHRTNGDWVRLYLLADPVCRPAIEESPPGEIPVESLATVLAFWESGELSKDAARRVFNAKAKTALVSNHSGFGARLTLAAVATARDTSVLERRGGTSDVLLRLVELYWDSLDALLRGGFGDLSPDERDSVALAMLRVARAVGWNEVAVYYGVLVFPELCLLPEICEESLRSALWEIAERKGKFLSFEMRRVAPLFRCSLLGSGDDLDFR